MSKNSYSRRDFAKAMAVGGLIGLAPRYGLAAASYPNRDIRLIVPWTAGGSSDVVMRVVGARMSERLGVPVLVQPAQH